MALRYHTPETYDHTRVVTGAQTNFPALIKKVATRYKHTSYGGHVTSQFGYDIRPYSDAGLTSALSYKLIRYDPVTGTVVMYVLIASLSNAVDGVVHLGYGDSGITTDGSSTAAWNSAFTLSMVPRTPFVDPVRYASNPILNRTSKAWHDSQVYDFCVVKDYTAPTTKRIMFFSGMAAPVQLGVQAIGRAKFNVSDPYTLTEDAAPVLQKGTGGEWDNSTYGIRVDSVVDVNDDGTLLYMYYTADLWFDSATNKVGLAISTDGGVTWTKDAASPVLHVGMANSGAETYNSQFAVLRLDSTHWVGLYSYRLAGDPLPGLRYATSADGKTWVKDGLGDVISRGSAGSADATFMEFHQLQLIGGFYYLTWEGGYQFSNLNRQAGHLARSATLPNTGGWTKAPCRPFMSPSRVAASYDENNISSSSLYLYGSTWYTYLCGGDNYTPALTVFSCGIASLGMQTPADAFGAVDIADQTSNAQNFTNNNGATVSNGVSDIIGALARFNGVDSSLTRANFTMPTTGTLEMWVKCHLDPQNGSSNLMFLNLSRPGGSPDDVFHMNLSGLGGGLARTGFGWYAHGTDKRVIADTALIAQDGWVYLMLSWTDGGTTTLRINGQAVATTSGLVTFDTSTFPLEIGKDTRDSLFTNFSLGAIRVSNVVRATSWTDTMYAIEAAPTTFWTSGTEVDNGPPASSGAPSLVVQSSAVDAVAVDQYPVVQSAVG